MCGICGIYHAPDLSPIDKMVATLRHRGPDVSGVYVNHDRGVSLGHARLSIIDLSEHGRQPMYNEDSTVIICVNGEIYNFKELRCDLKDKGHTFKSDSDSEVITHLYEDYGFEFVAQLRGMFAIALYDSKEDSMILVRDRIGQKPLYYYWNGKILIFASEIKAILAYGVEVKLNEDGMLDYLRYQYTMDDKTMFKGINKLKPAHILVADRDGITVKPYWNIEVGGSNDEETYCVERLHGLLKEATALRMIADVPVGAYLSGGVDSSAIVALARPHIGKLHTISMGFDTFSELPYARKVADWLNTTHHEVMLLPSMVEQDLRKIAWYYDEPLGDAAIINNYYLAQEARKYVKVVLAGEGGDELFGGYRHYQLGLKWIRWNRLPLCLRTLGQSVIRRLPEHGSMCMAGVHHIGMLGCMSNMRSAQMYIERALDDSEMIWMGRLPLRGVIQNNSHSDFPTYADDALTDMLIRDCHNLLPEKFLMKADKASMANSIEERLPLLDQEIIQFAFGISSDLKIHNGQEKYILRKAVSGILPHGIMNRPKQVFNTPVNHWLCFMANLVHDRLTHGELLKWYFKHSALENMSRIVGSGELMRRRGINGHLTTNAIWTLFALQLWHDVYFEGNV